MMRKVALCLTIAMLADVSAAFAGPLADSGKRAALQATAQPARSHKKALIWSGIALVVVGATMVQVYGSGDPSCATRECPDPQGELPKVFLGLGLAAIGATVTIVGVSKSARIQIRF